MNQTLQLFLHLLTLCFATTSLSKGYSSIIDELETNLENLLRDGSILGAQALVGEGAVAVPILSDVDRTRTVGARREEVIRAEIIVAHAVVPPVGIDDLG